ncbi:hypothetical protein [Sphingomonas morindae]|uniref:Uncharacterized protein n=1 Tax=Sphingomonas morindae TaxID=1541170 RepID=A0ABY4X623_9SPHN|nr:hypothetical protein [Sphingomonas morindae]USI72342.1 hypothetical protein LHA26_13730 [Sphingomonas morindae]
MPCLAAPLPHAPARSAPPRGRAGLVLAALALLAALLLGGRALARYFDDNAPALVLMLALAISLVPVLPHGGGRRPR